MKLLNSRNKLFLASLALLKSDNVSSGLGWELVTSVGLATWAAHLFAEVVGDHVRHTAFGEGTVVTSKLTRDDEEVTIAFPERGVKKLLASMANLELLG